MSLSRGSTQRTSRRENNCKQRGALACDITKRCSSDRRCKAAHSGAIVQAAFRRQLERRQLYKRVVRSLKICLGELAQITLNDLRLDQQHDTKVSEYEAVMTGLDQQLARRKHHLIDMQKLNHKLLLQRRDAEVYSRRNQCYILLGEIQERQLVELEHNMIQIHRAQLCHEAEPRYKAEYEDVIVQPRREIAHISGLLNSINLWCKFGGRSTTDIERKVDDLRHRTNMWEALRAYNDEKIEDFAVQGSAAREAADEELRGVNITSQPITEYDGLHTTPMPLQTVAVPTSEGLTPLNVLAEIAVTSSLRCQSEKHRHILFSSIETSVYNTSDIVQVLPARHSCFSETQRSHRDQQLAGERSDGLSSGWPSITHPPSAFHRNPGRSSAALTVPQHMSQSTRPTNVHLTRRALLPPTAQPINHLADTMGGLAGDFSGSTTFQPRSRDALYGRREKAQ